MASRTGQQWKTGVYQVVIRKARRSKTVERWFNSREEAGRVFAAFEEKKWVVIRFWYVHA